MKNPSKKLEISQFLPRFQALALLFLRNSYLSKNLITIFGNVVRQRVSADLSRLDIRDSDKANQDEIAAHFVCIYSSCGRNNMKSLQRQIHLLHKSLGTNTDVIKQVDCIPNTGSNKPCDKELRWLIVGWLKTSLGKSGSHKAFRQMYTRKPPPCFFHTCASHCWHVRLQHGLCIMAAQQRLGHAAKIILPRTSMRLVHLSINYGVSRMSVTRISPLLCLPDSNVLCIMGQV